MKRSRFFNQKFPFYFSALILSEPLILFKYQSWKIVVPTSKDEKIKVKCARLVACLRYLAEAKPCAWTGESNIDGTHMYIWAVGKGHCKLNKILVTKKLLTPKNHSETHVWQPKKQMYVTAPFLFTYCPRAS